MRQAPPVVLTIAGFDPSAGAGVTADIKTIAAHGCYGVACITALTVQSTAAVRRVQAVDATVVKETLEELAQDIEIAAVHIGMLGNGPIAGEVASFLKKHKPEQIVLDPILKSSSGAELLDAGGRQVLIKKLLPLATVVTPNLDEAAVLSQLPVTSLQEMKAAARRIHAMGAKTVVVTGGHLEEAIDVLSTASRGRIEQRIFRSERIRSSATHGTGCGFSTSIACQLALGRDLRDAVLQAKNYVGEAIAQAYPLGRGMGPMHHLYGMQAAHEDVQRRPKKRTSPS